MGYSKSIKKLLTNSQLLKSNLLNVKKYSFFLKKTNKNFSLYGYKRIYEQLKPLIFKLNGFLYNRWSLYKRRSNPSDFFLNLQKNNKFPWVLISFSKETDNAILREFSKFGIPIIYLLEGYNHFEFKDYPIMGSYSREMLNFYLNILKYCLK